MHTCVDAHAHSQPRHHQRPLPTQRWAAAVSQSDCPAVNVGQQAGRPLDRQKLLLSLQDSSKQPARPRYEEGTTCLLCL